MFSVLDLFMILKKKNPQFVFGNTSFRLWDTKIMYVSFGFDEILYKVTVYKTMYNVTSWVTKVGMKLSREQMHLFGSFLILPWIYTTVVYWEYLFLSLWPCICLCFHNFFSLLSLSSVFWTWGVGSEEKIWGDILESKDLLVHMRVRDEF